MTYYIFIENGKINGCGECKQLTEGVFNYETDEEFFTSFMANPEHYKYENEQVIKFSEEEIAIIEKQKERERLDMLSLTAADVERAIYKAKGIDFEDIVELVKNNPQIDIKALNIELKANNFYRGNPYINQIGSILGYTSDDLDYLFVNKELLKKEEIKE